MTSFYDDGGETSGFIPENLTSCVAIGCSRKLHVGEWVSRLLRD